MVTYRTNEDITREHVAALGPVLGSEFDALFTEVVWIHDKWREYCALFCASAATTDVLNEAAARFFGALQESLWEDTLLHIARLTDPPRPRRATLTIRRLPNLINDVAVRDRVMALVEIAVAKCGFARDWRNRRIAHRDLALALDTPATPLAEASRLSTREALAAIADVLQHIDTHYMDGGLSFAIPGGPGDAFDLIRVLEEGLHAVRLREERFRNGTWTPDDLPPRHAV